MPGHILLAGGAEFGGRMAEPDLRAIELAGGVDARILAAEQQSLRCRVAT